MLGMEHTRMMKMFKSLEKTGLKGFLGIFGLVAPNKKKEMKVEYRMLHDIVAKALYAKAGSFDVVTSEKFDFMVAISAGLKVNWAHVLFQTLVAMVHTPTRQEFAVSVFSA
ncbi:hypothetical protein F511_15497 [Dorcoceras hygrometricum]|uniref:Uncharacterized protein n=1 Tax=Dorcoceras hygrometricum TaxID=472368 RepID=A0A2Z7DKA7_9LAMI|nr:hypothetical protein F511_15497 [Dorcoceras hygrometricum]